VRRGDDCIHAHRLGGASDSWIMTGLGNLCGARKEGRSVDGYVKSGSLAGHEVGYGRKDVEEGLDESGVDEEGLSLLCGEGRAVLIGDANEGRGSRRNHNNSDQVHGNILYVVELKE